MINMLYKIVAILERYFEDDYKMRITGEILSIVVMIGMIIVLLIAIF